MKKIIVMVAVCLLSVALFAQTGDVLSLEDAIALYEGKMDVGTIKNLVAEDINATDYIGYTSLMLASAYGYTEIVRSLIADGANMDAKNDNDATALILTAQKGYADIVKLLIEVGANLDAKTNSGDTALMYATSEGHTAVETLLKATGAKE